MAASIEQVTIWVLEELEKERRREPDLLKCRLPSEVLGPLKDRHGITDGEISSALRFMQDGSRRYLTVIDRPDGQAILPSENGLAILDKIAEVRLDEQEKKKWSRADKIALAGLILSVVTFFAGLWVGKQSGKDSAKILPPQQSTNAVNATSLKSP